MKNIPAIRAIQECSKKGPSINRVWNMQAFPVISTGIT